VFSAVDESTVASLLSAPIHLAAPTPAIETSVLRPMGFLYEYLTYYATGLGEALSGYQFDIIPAIADLCLWFGVPFYLESSQENDFPKSRESVKIRKLSDLDNDPFRF
jgi:hypothetical protein